VGVDNCEDFLKISVARRRLLEHEKDAWIEKIPDLRTLKSEDNSLP